MQQISDFDYDDFDIMIRKINEIQINSLNRDCWENSVCNCREWMTFYKCNHVISLAARLKLCNHVSVAYSIPIIHCQEKQLKLRQKLV